MKRALLLSAAVAVLAAATPLRAETLFEALAAAYETNPDLNAQRAIQRQLDAGVAAAASEGRPSISGTVSAQQNSENTGSFDNDGRQLTAQGTLGMPLFAGGRIRNSIRAADRRVDAGRQDLRSVENDVFVDTVAAYLDVLRDQSVVELNEGQVRVLTEQLRASRDRFEVGDLTRTDVAQSEARLATAQANLRAARGQLIFSREGYRRIVGRAPGTLEPPPPLPTLPGTAEQAVDQAIADNPALKSAKLAERAASYDVKVARGANLPTVSASTGVRYTDALGTGNAGVAIPGQFQIRDNDTAQTTGISMTVPLYEAGGTAARIRQAQAAQSRALEQSIGVERIVVANARNAFESVATSRAVIESAEVAVRANTLALEGTRQENAVGSRTILDVLDAEQELLNSRVSLVRAQRDAYVAGFQLLAALGRAEADDLGLGVTAYDPTVNYRRVRNSWFDWGAGEKVKARSTSTVGADSAPATPATPAQ
jgi:outer membrane protein